MNEKDLPKFSLTDWILHHINGVLKQDSIKNIFIDQAKKQCPNLTDEYLTKVFNWIPVYIRDTLCESFPHSFRYIDAEKACVKDNIIPTICEKCDKTYKLYAKCECSDQFIGDGKPYCYASKSRFEERPLFTGTYFGCKC